MSQSLRIFLSSTWVDLQPERQALETAVHNLRSTEAVEIEFYDSDPDAPLTSNLAQLDAGDLFISLIAHLYGSGFIEVAYRRARQLDMPFLIYLKDENAAVLPSFIEQDVRKRGKLNALKQELKEHTGAAMFKTPDQLAALVTADLHSLLAEIKKNKTARSGTARPSTQLPPTYIVSGDLVFGDKTGGDKISLDNISNSNIAAGESSSVSAAQGSTGPPQDSGYGGQDPAIADLHKQLVTKFDLEELESLSFELGIDFDEIKGKSKSAKARDLLLYLQRRGQLDRLHEAIQRLRG